MVVRLVRGEWKRDEYGCYEHVADLDGLCLAVKLRERDTFAKVVTAVKERLSLRSEDEVELSYQWSQWMMGADWERANPIHILDDEDMTLFMAIRSDLEEVHLKVKIIQKMLGASTVNSYPSVLDIRNMTSEAISDNVTGDLGLDKYGAGTHIVRGGGITIRENVGETGVGSVAPRTLTQGQPSATAKGKERSMVGQLVTTPAKATNNEVRGQTSSNPEEAIRLTLGNADPAVDVVSVVALSSTDSTFKTPSNSISFSSEDLMDEDEVSSKNCLARIGEDEVAHYYSDPDGPLCMAPMNTQKMSRVNNIVRGEIVATEAQVSELNTHVRRRLADIYLKETPVPTVLIDRDAPPYFDDPREEDYLHRALKDADYEGDDIFIGRLFKNKEDCATKLAIHAIRRKFHFITTKSCPNIVLAVCCSVRGDFQKQASTAVIGQLMRTKYLGVGRGPRPNELRKMLRDEFSLNVSYWKAWRAREIAMDNAMGSAMGLSDLITRGLRCACKEKHSVDFQVGRVELSSGQCGLSLQGNLLPPKVNEMVIENVEKGAGFVVLKIGDAFYEVRDREDSAFAVNLWERSCTCREFQLLTIPCSYAIAAAIKEGIRVETMVGVHHTVPYLKLAYKGMIMPVPDMDTLTPSPSDVGGGKLASPYVRRPPGRPRKRRLFSREEF
ncbi:unnamed protein product [Arabidopsis thaliana]|uniref:(thale cress) hypothetical protein n=1 Tax=Arabidopsis thaliana TaxID=3702 RepID=A0A7G2EUI9_ARATH|nr:unnamed protein product [Arabidopsis thaliana]